MTEYKSHTEMKIGDKVWSSAVNGGIVTVGHVATLEPCHKEGCTSRVLTLKEDRDKGNVIWAYHTENFVVLEGE